MRDAHLSDTDDPCAGHHVVPGPAVLPEEHDQRAEADRDGAEDLEEEPNKCLPVADSRPGCPGWPDDGDLEERFARRPSTPREPSHRVPEIGGDDEDPG